MVSVSLSLSLSVSASFFVLQHGHVIHARFHVQHVVLQRVSPLMKGWSVDLHTWVELVWPILASVHVLANNYTPVFVHIAWFILRVGQHC
jgi:hypothetical protein